MLLPPLLEAEKFTQKPTLLGRYQFAKESNFQPVSDEFEWLLIDPYSSLNAMHIVSWKQEFEIKLLIKLKLNAYAFVFDQNLERSLENFIQLKLKQEIHNKSLQKRNSHL